MCKKRITINLIVLFTALLVNSGCVYIPLPSHDMSSDEGMIPLEVINSLKKGETTREDLLLLVGAPNGVHEGDRYFTYSWKATEGAVGFPGGGAYVVKTHYFCVAFDENNRVKRFIHIKSGLIDSIYKDGRDADKQLLEWKSNPDK